MVRFVSLFMGPRENLVSSRCLFDTGRGDVVVRVEMLSAIGSAASQSLGSSAAASATDKCAAAATQFPSLHLPAHATTTLLFEFDSSRGQQPPQTREERSLSSVRPPSTSPEVEANTGGRVLEGEADAQFEIASCSKLLVACAVMLLVEARALALDDTIAQVLLPSVRQKRATDSSSSSSSTSVRDHSCGSESPFAPCGSAALPRSSSSSPTACAANAPSSVIGAPDPNSPAAPNAKEEESNYEYVSALEAVLARYGGATIRQLLQHTSGIPDFWTAKDACRRDPSDAAERKREDQQPLDNAFVRAFNAYVLHCFSIPPVLLRGCIYMMVVVRWFACSHRLL